MSIKFVEMKQKDIKTLKEKIWLQNNKRCPLLNIEVELDKCSLDHIHKLKSEAYDIEKGTIRNTLEFRANAMEGKITNNWKRYFGSDASKHPCTLPDFLRNLADYLENPSYCETYDNEDTYFIHPTEVPAVPKLMKSSYNKLQRVYNGKAKFPSYPKSGKLTKQLEKLFSQFEISPEFYS